LPGLFLFSCKMDTKKRHCFPKAEHLKSRKQIEQLFAGGPSFFTHPLKVYWHLNAIEGAELPAIKVGVSASKRNFKKAADRNRVKRLIRETYRLNKDRLQQSPEKNSFSLEIFFIYVDKTLPTFDVLEVKMKACLTRLKKIVEEAL
jgi:ribonuclease P protein component